jgi:hypothetical protein
MWIRPYSDPAPQTGHFICYGHRTDHVLPTIVPEQFDTCSFSVYKRPAESIAGTKLLPLRFNAPEGLRTSAR